jgi:hypothetical protein
MIVACSKLALERISRAVLAEPCQKQVLRESCCGEIAAGYEIRGIGDAFPGGILPTVLEALS